MTLREYIEDSIVIRGMPRDQAMGLLDQYISLQSDMYMNNKWDDSIDLYTKEFKDILWIGIRHFVFRWIERNLPEIWFKEMFQYSDEELLKIRTKYKLIIQ